MRNNFMPKFQIGDRVCTHDQTGHPWFVIGVVMRPSYDVVSWVYVLGRGVYGDHNFNSFGCRMDVETKDPCREDTLITEAEWLEVRRNRLNAQIEETERLLADLQKKRDSDGVV